MRPLSHSSINLYLDCPKKWHFKYIEKVPEKPRHFFSFGKTVHNTLEYFYDVKVTPPPSLEEILTHYEDNWIAEGYKDKKQEEDYRRQGKRILEEYYAKHIDSFRIPYFTEYGFNLEVNGVKVVGYIDRIDKNDDDTLTIVDYKTGKAIPKTRAATDAQLTMYQMACEELLGLQVKDLVFYHLPSQTPIHSKPHGPTQVDALRERIVTTADLIKAEKFAPKPEERKCGWCDYKPLCPVFKHLFTKREPPEHAPALTSDDKLAKMVDRFGKMKEEIKETKTKVEELKEEIVAVLKEKGYVRAFGQNFEATAHFDDRWDFKDKDKKKVLEAIERAGFWDKILAPSAPAVQKLMKDPNLPLQLRDKLQKLGTLNAHATVRVRKTEADGD
jgi:putative RecB family exonuclease